MNLSLVMRGLDSRIDDEAQHATSFRMDCRVDPGKDILNQSLKRLTRNLIFRVAPHHLEISSFFSFARWMNAARVSGPSNQKVKS